MDIRPSRDCCQIGWVLGLTTDGVTIVGKQESITFFGERNGEKDKDQGYAS